MMWHEGCLKMIIENELIIRASIFIITVIFSYIALDRAEIARQYNVLISFIIGIFAFLFATQEAIGLMVGWFFVPAGFILGTVLIFLILLVFVSSLKSSGLRRIFWAIFTCLVIYLFAKNDIDLPGYVITVFLFLMLVLIIFDKWVMYLINRRKIVRTLNRER